MSDRCLDCHQGVQRPDRGQEGHPRRPRRQALDDVCSACHPEHNGPTGAHRARRRRPSPTTSPATRCAVTRGRRREPASPAPTATPTTCMTFDQAICADCHAEIDAAFMSRHEATYGNDCLPCHDGSGRDGANFDHSTVAVQADRQARRRGLRASATPRPAPARASRRRRRTATRATRRTTSTTARMAPLRGVPHRRGLGRRQLRPHRLPARPRQRGAQGHLRDVPSRPT